MLLLDLVGENKMKIIYFIAAFVLVFAGCQYDKPFVFDYNILEKTYIDSNGNGESDTVEYKIELLNTGGKSGFIEKRLIAVCKKGEYILDGFYGHIAPKKSVIIEGTENIGDNEIWYLCVR
jgi:hypothetical protein